MLTRQNVHSEKLIVQIPRTSNTKIASLETITKKRIGDNL